MGCTEEGVSEKAVEPKGKKERLKRMVGEKEKEDHLESEIRERMPSVLLVTISTF